MNFNIKDGMIEMQGFDIGNKILISDADEVTFSDCENGEYEKAKTIKVVMEVETLAEWLNDCDVLEELGLNVW